MTKLQTPISFENALSVFNEPRPLTLRDVVLPRLTLPVGGVDPVGVEQAARGKLLQANQQGGQLIVPPGTRQNFETLTTTWEAPDKDQRTFTFAQRVYGVALEISAFGVSQLYWRMVVGQPPIQTYTAVGSHWINFMGTTMLWDRQIGVGTTTIILTGLY